MHLIHLSVIWKTHGKLHYLPVKFKTHLVIFTIQDTILDSVTFTIQDTILHSFTYKNQDTYYTYMKLQNIHFT